MKKTWLLIGLLAILVVTSVLLAGHSNSDKGPQGTLAMRRFLAGMGLRVTDANHPPPAPGIFVLLADFRTPGQADELLNWVRQGGTLVVADPASNILGEAGIYSPDILGHNAFGPDRIPPDCVAAETLGVSSIAADPENSALAAADPGAVGCFPLSGGFFEISDPMGRGRLVALGGDSVFTNALLSTASNARFGFGLLSGSGTPGDVSAGVVTFGPAVPPGPVATPGLWASLPLGVKALIIQIGVAAVIFALIRGRRFGKPTLEQLPSPVPAGALVDAVGRLYRAGQDRAFAGETLRRATLQQLSARLGTAAVTPGDLEAISSSAAQRSREDPLAVRRLLAGPPPADDAELIALGRDLEELRRKVDGSLL